MTAIATNRYAWRGRAWEDMPKWMRLCSVLDARGPMTTGALGHIKGLGENIRGIRREAQTNLRADGMDVVSEKTEGFDAEGNRIANATYRLVDTILMGHLERTAEEIERRKAERLGLTAEASAQGVSTTDEEIAPMPNQGEGGAQALPQDGPGIRSGNQAEVRPVSPMDLLRQQREAEEAQKEPQPQPLQLGFGI